MTRTLLATTAAVLIAAATASAQPRERVFIAVNGGMQAATPKLSDGFSYDVNAEPAQVDVRYPSTSGVLLDGTVGVRLFSWGGLAVGGSRFSGSDAAHVEADIPHPLYDDQDRHVAGDTTALDRIESAIHANIYWLKASGRWRIRLMGGASYFRVEQEAVTAVNVAETYPFDTASFESATTERANGSAPGFNAGADVAWMLTPRVGLGALVRFARGSVDLDVDGGRRVSTTAGGVQAGAGLRFIF